MKIVTMDHWKKIYVLGAGSYGRVYYAVHIDPSSSRAYVAAVKCADNSLSGSLQKEAQILTTLKGCPYVVQFFGADVSIDNGNIPIYNLFLEYASGGSLHDLINNSKRGMIKMSELEVSFYTYQILKGIQHVHKKGYVHCDIKPANILVFNNERGGMHKLKLADFGLSLKVGDRMTYMTGIPLSNRGTLLYAPPESLICGIHAKAYDIWSLGCTVVEMITGNRFWIHCDTKDLQWKIMNDEDPEIPSNVSEIARDFLHKCLITDPVRRWTSDQLLDHPFIQQALCTASMSMPETQEVTARVNPFGCQIPIPEKDFINALFKTS
ncbi:mitogen-activated protein kinase kinase kinase 20-like [Solanum dulcamara]|uniref:mitogen-activated protein kinase kinase kinase 20-like n=1 Tax=Solanum dulcamara TaxID=45834 RepID=UPI002485B0EB|nr:mitogen-activated protein kinase kinase kinase 20-like [Solanum dulcamara]